MTLKVIISAIWNLSESNTLIDKLTAHNRSVVFSSTDEQEIVRRFTMLNQSVKTGDISKTIQDRDMVTTHYWLEAMTFRIAPFPIADVHWPPACKRKKGKEDHLYSAILVCHTHKAVMHGSHSFTCKLHHACLSFANVQQMAPPLNEVADTQLQLTCRRGVICR